MMRKHFFIFLMCISSFMHAETNVRLYTENYEGGINLYVDNYEFCPVSLVINFKVKNLKLNTKQRQYFVVKELKNRRLLLQIPIVNLYKKSRISYEFLVSRGDYRLKKNCIEAGYVYDLPFEGSCKVSQGYQGAYTHKGINALDFMLPIGAKVIAVRDGVVVELVDTYTKGCNSLVCEKYANYIVVYHSDGTFASYSHLKVHGAVASVGNKVKKGELIAYSGNTGYSSGPHLHFEVYLKNFNKKQTLKTKFRIDKGEKVMYLKEQTNYTRKYK